MPDIDLDPVVEEFESALTRDPLRDVPPVPPITSYCPDISMIPLEAIERLSARFELGAPKYGRDSWRKNMKEQGVNYLIERLNHGIYHMLRLQQKLLGHLPMDKDDDIGAALWSAAIAAAGVKMLGIDHNFDPKAKV